MENNSRNGEIQISDGVLAIIASATAFEVAGVAKSYFLPAKRFYRKSQPRTVSIKSENGFVNVELSIVVKFGYKVHQVAADVQTKIKNSLESMVGVRVKSVTVNVIGIKLEKPLKKPTKKRK